CDRPRPRREARAIGLGELKRGGRAVARADRLVKGRGRRRRRAGLVVGPVLPAEAVQPPAPLLEEGDHGVKVVGALDAVAGVVAALGIGPAAVALLGA